MIIEIVGSDGESQIVQYVAAETSRATATDSQTDNPAEVDGGEASIRAAEEAMAAYEASFAQESSQPESPGLSKAAPAA